MVRRWAVSEELETLQAGLFLTIIPVFNVQIRLISTGTPNIVLRSLQQLSVHISSITKNLSFVNPTIPADTSGQDSAPLETSRLGALLNTRLNSTFYKIHSIEVCSR
ncbi:hypothetical protein C8Q76DRAFT_757643 [Earliella scabrosa]|nr:hypothetical protein C8Q76DRAFT_757643 [Earliella scabrosa]